MATIIEPSFYDGLDKERIIYYMHCGCIYDGAEIKTFIKETKRHFSTNIIHCPIHGKKIKERKAYCITCGFIFTLNSKGAPKHNCPKCEKEKKEKAKKTGIKEELKFYDWEKEKPKKADENRWDCIHYHGKCEKEAFMENWNTRPCKDCPEYISLKEKVLYD